MSVDLGSRHNNKNKRHTNNWGTKLETSGSDAAEDKENRKTRTTNTRQKGNEATRVRKVVRGRSRKK